MNAVPPRAPTASPQKMIGRGSASGDFDVVIVGGGPTGLVAAAILGRRWRVLLVERHPQPYGLPRAGHIDHEIMRILQGIGAHRPLIDDGVTNAAYRWFNGDGKLLIEFRRGTSVSGFNSDYMMYQPVFEDAVTEAIRDRAKGVEVRLGWTAFSLAEDGDGVEVELASTLGDQPNQRVRATYLLGADGARSTIRGLLGVTRTDLGFAEDWLDVDVRLLRPLEGEMYGQYCDPARPAYIGSLGKRHHRFEFARLPGETSEELERPETAWKLLAGYGVGPDDVEIVRQVVYTFEARVADSWSRGRVYLMGDAVHTMPPHFGQGLCSGVRDSANLAWKLDLVLAGAADESILDTYEAERKPHADTWVDNSVRVGRISCTLDVDAAQARDERILGGDVPSFPRPGLVAGVLQGVSPGVEPVPPVGMIAPQPIISDGAKTGLLHDLVGHGFVLVYRGQLDLNESQERTFRRLDVTIVPVRDNGTGLGYIDVNGTLSEYFDEYGIDAFLIRPDYYVYGVTPAGSTPAGILDDLRSDVPEPGTPRARANMVVGS